MKHRWDDEIEEDEDDKIEPLLDSHSLGKPSRFDDLDEVEHYDHMDYGMLCEFGIHENLGQDWD